ncbi:nitrite reductase small subunit NirD [Bacillus sp. BRMEA1]|uniref:nitrite reductase small subunit NirD n=1 Tax=Neobacillus endophyticus TaxID=2738405 RepID=UPI00156438AB|nr:nitrite reductase small subunit NirD [Neobacillus endophyticus]NRD77867.1 nitrite reductase small subunit NirD [Neobacillus endophyticus]
MEAIRYRIKVGALNEIPEKLGKTVKIGAHEIAIFRLANGEIRAIENRCPHKGGVLAEGMVSGEHVFCPMHDWKINLKDGKVQAPDIGCVKTYKTELQDGEVIVIL